ncbi:MAG TPA: hypothetical protein VN616_06470 [Puia sp.]|nr:hypothetical protein [Puia sp.]
MRPLSGYFLIVASLLLQNPAARAQGPVFGVYFNAGNIRYTPAHGGGTQLLGYHNWLFDGDKLSLQDNISELILFDRDSNYVKLEGKGNYTVAQMGQLPRHRLTDTVEIRYASLFWADAPQPTVRATGRHRSRGEPNPPSGGHDRSNDSLNAPGSHNRPNDSLNALRVAAPTKIGRAPTLTSSAPLVLIPRNGYATSLDSCIFRWHRIGWARKYFLRMRTAQGEIRYDSVVADTQAIIHLAGHLPPDTYYWALDIVGESGRLQFGDSGHIIVVDEATVIKQLPALQEDSLGGITSVLRKINQYETSGCTGSADEMYRQLLAAFPTDGALFRMYDAFLTRNGLR